MLGTLVTRAFARDHLRRNDRGEVIEALRADQPRRVALIGNPLPVLFSRAMNAPTREVNESTVCPVGASLWL
jgi:hypothetical protein